MSTTTAARTLGFLVGQWLAADREKLEDEIAEVLLKEQGKDAMLVMDGREFVIRKKHNKKDGTVIEGVTLSPVKPRVAKERKVVTFTAAAELTSEGAGESADAPAETAPAEPAAETASQPTGRRGRKGQAAEAAPEAPAAE